MAMFVDSEMAGASGFADCINLAPGVKERITAARIVLEKFGHAEKVLDLMEQFGANTAQYVGAHPWAARLDRSADLGTRRIDGDMRLNVFHYPIYGWVDAVVLNCLMGQASVVQIDELTRGSYQPLADAMATILPVEQRHAELGEQGCAGARAGARSDRRPSLGELLVSASRRHVRPQCFRPLRHLPPVLAASQEARRALERMAERVDPVLGELALTVPPLKS